MSISEEKLNELLSKKNQADLLVETLGQLRVIRNKEELNDKSWGRDKALQLFEFLVTARNRMALHKEQIIARIWEDASQKEGDNNFKVALHGINKALEPERKSRTEPKYISRQGLTYRLKKEIVWIDVDAVDELIQFANEQLEINVDLSILALKEATKLFQGIYLPNRIYEDWATVERERLQVLILGAYILLGELLLDSNPLESIRLAQNALQMDQTWEDAHRLLMNAYMHKGNRPSAIKAYKNCVKILDKEFGIEPLPETEKLYQEIVSG